MFSLPNEPLTPHPVLKTTICPSVLRSVQNHLPQERWFYFRLNPNVFIIMVAMKFRYAMVCSSNQNRSMEAHFLLKRQGFDVSSYGTGAHVKLPGPSLREPNVYEFGTPYKHMFDDLRRKDPELYPPSLHSSSSSLPPL